MLRGNVKGWPVQLSNPVNYEGGGSTGGGGDTSSEPAPAASDGIDMEDTVAFGDGDNDSDMIRDVGYGIAMANGRDVVKKVAKRVTEFTNDEDGVAKMLSILQEEGVFPGSNNS